jgi:hypothetical protein
MAIPRALADALHPMIRSLPSRLARRLAAVVSIAAAIAVAAPVGAQANAVGDAEAAESLAEPLAEPECPRGRISSVWVDNNSVFDLTDPNRSMRFDWAFRLANRLHIRTREDVIRRELVFEEGGCYEPALLRESERVLRATTFIAEVDIYGVEQPDGSYHVIVDTRDEWTTRIEPQTGPGTGLQLTGIALREDNLLGTGRQAAAFYLEDRESRVYGVSYLHPQLFATRWQAGFSVGRTPIGSMFREAVEYPFIGESGRLAFRHSFEHHERYFGYLASHDGARLEVLMPERRRSFDLGGAVRFGPRGSLTLLGARLTGDWIAYPGDPRLVDRSLPVPDSLFHPINVGVDSVSDVRAILIVGQRNVHYVRQRALDTVQGTEDVRLGIEVELGMGSSIRPLSSGSDLSLDLGLFAAGQIDQLMTGTRLVLEGRRNYEAPADASEWDDVFGQLDAWAYWRPSPESRHLFVGMLAASGGWHARVPFQLTLGGATGMRGHPMHAVAGGRRMIASLEARSYLGWPYPQLFDLGGVAFVDAGRMWAGDIPYGENSRTLANLGVGIRAAFPPGSLNTFRLDVATPIERGSAFSGIVFSLGVGQAIGRAPRWDPELFRSSRREISTSAFRVRADRDP